MTDQNLASLIDLAFERHEVSSGAELERVAQGFGYKIVATTINHIRAGTYKPKPRPDTLKAIARLAGVTLAEAYTAADLPAPGPPFTEEIAAVEGIDYLTPDERDVIIHMCRVLAERHKTGLGQSRPYPMPNSSDPHRRFLPVVPHHLQDSENVRHSRES